MHPILIFLALLLIVKQAGAYTNIQNDDFLDNSLNTLFWNSTTTGNGAVNETNHSIEITETANADGAYIVTKNHYGNGYDVHMKMNFTKLTSGVGGLNIFNTNKTPSFSNNSKTGIVVSQAAGKILMFYYNRSNALNYYNPVSKTWGSAVAGVSGAINWNYTFEIVKNETGWYNYTIYNPNGTVRASSTAISADSIQNGEYPDYFGFGEFATSTGNMNIVMNNFSLQYTVSATTTSTISARCNTVASWGEIGFALFAVLIIVIGGSIVLGYLNFETISDLNLSIEFVFAIVVSVIIGLIGIAMLSPIFTAMGCT